MSHPAPLIDSHCHLEYEYENATVEAIIHEAKQNGINGLITIGTEKPSMEKVIEISEKFDEVVHTVGIHPHEAKTIDDPDLDWLKGLSTHEKCKAIGEIGLDFHYDHSPREVQKKRLEDQLEIAKDTGLPVVIHARDAEPELVESLTRFSKSRSGNSAPGVIHCFSGTKDFGRKCLDAGFFISFSGIITFKKSDDLRDCAVDFPLERLLVETDSPYLAPVPMRGKQCRPAMVRHTAEKLAELKKVDVAEISANTMKNTRELFGLPETWGN